MLGETTKNLRGNVNQMKTYKKVFTTVQKKSI